MVGGLGGVLGEEAAVKMYCRREEFFSDVNHHIRSKQLLFSCKEKGAHIETPLLKIILPWPLSFPR